MDYRRCIEITRQVASALSVAHKHNIIHRDIKPHNIMITEDGMAKLGDFGKAKAVSDSTLTETSKIIGSVHYFSPEQARGAYVDERSDLYSLGIVLYEMLTGQVPFDGDNPVQVALMHINDEIVPPSRLVPGIPPALEQMVMKATDKYQSNRYKSAEEMLEAIDNIEFVTKMVGNSVFAADDVRKFQEENQKKQKPVRQEPVAEDDDDDYYEPVKKKKASGKKKKSKKGLIIAIIAILAVAGVFGALYATGMISFGTTVPDVTGKSYTEAKSTLESAGFKCEKGDTVASDDIDKGYVATQNPSANSKAKKGTTVTVNISSGKATGQVPNLVGKYYDKDDTKTYVESMNFSLGSVSNAKSDKYEKGQIISQSPTAGSQKPKGTTIDIVVCSGKKTETGTVPSLTGLTLDEAKQKITNAGFTFGGATYEESTVYGEGYVMWQQYEAGSSLKKGTAISVKVSKGAPSTDGETTDNTGSGSSSGSSSSGSSSSSGN